MGIEVGKIGTSRLPEKFTDTNDQSENSSGSNKSGTKQVDTGVYVNQGDLSSRLTELENKNKKVKINKGKNTKSSETIDILQYSSRDDHLYLNGRITAHGFIYNELCIFLKEIFKAFGITIFKGLDNVYWCRHLAFAVMKGYLTKEDIKNVKSKEDFIKLLDSMKDIEEIKQSLAKNATVLDKLEKDYVDFSDGLGFSMYMSGVPYSTIEPTNMDVLMSTVEKMQRHLSYIIITEDKENSILAKDKITLKKAQISITTIHKLSKNLKRELTWQEEEKICNKIAKQLDIVQNLLSSYKSTDKHRKILQLLNNMNNSVRKIIDPLTRQISQVQEENTPILEYMQRIADSFKQYGYKQEYKIITSILENKYITHGDIKTLKDKVYQKNYDFVSKFCIKDQGRKIGDHAYQLNQYRCNSVVCSESGFSETLYYLCKTISNDSEPTEKSFLFETPNHAMNLTIKSNGDKIHLIFYDPNETTTFQEIELSSMDMVQNIKIKDFFSTFSRQDYQLAGFKNILTGSLNDKLNIRLYENM